MTIEFRLLGEIEARVAGQPIVIGFAQLRCVLAVLLVEANHTVSVDQLLDRVWGPRREPRRPRDAVQHRIALLRKALTAVPGVTITTHTTGYRLVVDPETVDLHRFESLVAQARASRADELTATLFTQALGLWRGEPLADLPDTTWTTSVRAALSQRRHAAQLDLGDAQLRLGQHAALLADLTNNPDRHPLDERLAGQYVLALYRSGRQAEALSHYQTLRHRLADELGTDPSPPLQRLYQQILHADPTVAAPASIRQTPKAAPEAAVPRNDLLGEVADFTGRAAELRDLRSALPADGTTATAVTIFAIDGMAGIGKTTLALRVAHLLKDRYPDAQLFIDLHAHTTSRDTLDPATALASLLHAIGVPAEHVPETLEDRAARWRAESAHRNVLVVLDNAASAAHVRPLLPGTAGSLILVTSRRRLVDLDVTHTLSLDLLPPDDAITLLARVIGHQRSAAEPAAVADVARLCGYLPLALRVAAARLRARPTWSVGYMAERLRDESRRLAELASGDRSVAAAFAASYQQLTPPLRRLFRLLGLIPGPHWDTPLAAALADTSLAGTESSLEQLLDVHLLLQPAPGRYQFHDLLRRHARTAAQREESAADRQAALNRILEYYRIVGSNAVATTLPATWRASTATVASGPVVFTAPSQARQWLETELANIHAAVRAVADAPGSAPLRLDLLTVLSHAQRVSGRLVESGATARRLLALLPADDHTRRATVAVLTAGTELVLGSSQEATAILHDHLGHSTGLPASGVVPQCLTAATLNTTTGLFDQSGRLLTTLAGMDLGPAERFAAAALRAVNAYSQGNLPVVGTLIGTADRLMNSLSASELAPYVAAICLLCEVEQQFTGRADAALDRLRHVIRLDRAGHNAMQPMLYVLQAVILGETGRLPDAVATAEQAVELARLTSPPHALGQLRCGQALVLIWRGDHNPALSTLAEAAAQCSPERVTQAALIQCVRGMALIESGETSTGVAAIEACYDKIANSGNIGILLRALETMAHAEAERGRAHAARGMVERAERICHRHPVRVAITNVIRAHALTSSDPDRSARLALDAARALASAGLRIQEGRAWLRAGLSLAHSGNHHQARDMLTTAAALWETSGARSMHLQATLALTELA
ncbi:AfsR/SARP family transcriptional regulator [Actinocrispum wychmicini]|uniref:DNA-binding SARP family transcriptional activator n=1 Tax=Actinocrispum wychmicini TaxID=1213861 RepID=A0A4R2JRF3_9PSEU|nr:BTAD domain-containing putative transcriptional regulator [Actinocrispum wychmicini]TCO59419.1 DNA-binding SARP family transcriptional activator [Actinocrispum wychmicini]